MTKITYKRMNFIWSLFVISEDLAVMIRAENLGTKRQVSQSLHLIHKQEHKAQNLRRTLEISKATISDILTPTAS